jgi:hypothetical protein
MPLPDVMNKWHSLSGKFRFYLTEKCGLAGGYRHERFRMQDFATIKMNDLNDIPRIDYLDALSMGYGKRPCRGNSGTFWIFRMF